MAPAVRGFEAWLVFHIHSLPSAKTNIPPAPSPLPSSLRNPAPRGPWGCEGHSWMGSKRASSPGGEGVEEAPGAATGASLGLSDGDPGRAVVSHAHDVVEVMQGLL
jgi:hypothetical protein